MKNLNRVLSVLLAFAMVIGFVPVLAQAADSIAVDSFENADNFDLYSTSNGGFQVVDGKLTPTGDVGEFKAIYKDNGQPIRAVSVEMHPNGNDGMYGGLYIGAANAANGQDAIDAFYVGIESNFPQNGAAFWEDAPNRLDIILGKFAQGWAGEPVGGRFVSETGAGNALFTGGNKQPITIRADLDGNVVTVTVSLVNNPGKSVSTTYTLPEGTELSLGDVGIRSHYNNASYDNFTVEYVAEEEAEMPAIVQGFENTDGMNLYSTSAGGFAAVDGKLVPSGDAGEFKAVYDAQGKVNSVSVELHPHGNDGPIYGGLYIGASNAANAQDSINAIYLGIESHFTGWDDAANRVDLVIGQFPAWVEHARVISETGAGNALFSGGVKEPITLRADIEGPKVTVTVSLVRDPSVSFGTTYIADHDLSMGQVGIRSHYNDASYDNFCVNSAPIAAAAITDFANADMMALYSSGNGGFAAVDGKLTPMGEPAELKAIYDNGGKRIDSVSVELHPAGNDGPIYGGLYIGASNAANAQDSINAIYIGIESHFTGWDDAANRVDLVIGQFPAWAEHARVVAETGNGNNLFSGGVKEPLVLRADLDGNKVTATVSLLRDPSKFITATYTAPNDLSVGQVGIRSHHNNAMYDNFAVNTAAVVNGQAYATVSQAVKMANGNVVKLLGSTDEVITVTGDVTIDLAGHKLTNVFAPAGSSLKIADSSSDAFTAPSGVAVVAGSVQPFAEADGKAYLLESQENVHTAHRYDAVLTHISLKPAQDALGYKAQVFGDETVLARVQSIGFELWLDDYPSVRREKPGATSATLRLQNILASNGGERNINAAAFVTFAAGESVHSFTGLQRTTSMKATLQYIDGIWNTYSIEQQDAVLALCNQYKDTVSAWELNNIFFDGVNFADPLSRGEQKYTFANTKTYRNGLDISGQWGVGEYTAGGEYGIGDPFVMRYNGKYYMYPSSGTPENGVAGVKVFSSDDLINWTYEGFALEAAEADRAYAPEVIYYNGWFYMCQSGSQIVDGEVKVGTGHYIYKSQSPTGPFEAVTDNFGYKIDGSIWVDDSGNLWFLYPKRMSGQSNGIYIAPLNPETMKPFGDTQLTASLLGNTSSNSTWVEGPGFFRRGDYLYLTYSGNKVTEDNYRVGYSYQKGFTPNATFIQPENNILLLATGPDNFRGLGHNSNVIGPDLDSWYAAYHNLVSVDGPQRRYMLDKLVTNGSQILANGPTYWSVDAPQGPDFEARDITADSLWFSSKPSAAVFTAEVNFTPAQGSVTRVVFGYVDQNNYGEVLWSDAHKTLTVNSVKDGSTTTLGSAQVSFLASNVLHTLRIEQGADRLIVYMDTMRKIDVQNAGAAGLLGLEGSFGYVAFSNNAFGTSDFDTVKQVGTFPAVHYLKGEYRGFCIANATVGGIRQGEKESTVCNADGSYSLKLDTEGDWVKYAIQVNADGVYDLSAALREDSNGQFQVIVDSNDIYEIDLDNLEGDVLSQLNLTAGKHTLKIRLRSGSLQVDTFTLSIPVSAE